MKSASDFKAIADASETRKKQRELQVTRDAEEAQLAERVLKRVYDEIEICAKRGDYFLDIPRGTPLEADVRKVWERIKADLDIAGFKMIGWQEVSYLLYWGPDK